MSPLLEPHLQELISEGESFPAGAQASNDLEPSPVCQSDEIQWYTHQVEMPTWWRELLEVPGNDDCWEFSQKVCASFEVLKAHNQAKGVDNDYTSPLAHPTMGKYRFMPPSDPRFSSQDC